MASHGAEPLPVLGGSGRGVSRGDQFQPPTFHPAAAPAIRWYDRITTSDQGVDTQFNPTADDRSRLADAIADAIAAAGDLPGPSCSGSINQVGVGHRISVLRQNNFTRLWGTVVLYNPWAKGGRHYRVVFDDGSCEDLSYKEMEVRTDLAPPTSSRAPHIENDISTTAVSLSAATVTRASVVDKPLFERE